MLRISDSYGSLACLAISCQQLNRGRLRVFDRSVSAAAVDMAEGVEAQAARVSVTGHGFELPLAEFRPPMLVPVGVESEGS